jgi:hypothetical protein
MPIWVTEIACTRWQADHPISVEEIKEFMREILTFMDCSPFVHRYAWFGAHPIMDAAVGQGNCLQENGRLSELGKLYATHVSVCSS